jgi:hypothetical protein
LKIQFLLKKKDDSKDKDIDKKFKAPIDDFNEDDYDLDEDIDLDDDLDRKWT